MASSRLKEKDLYVAVERWAGRHFGCFATSVNTGTTYGRVDVVGLRQTPGDHSAETDLICIEVKRGKDPLLKAMGQAYGYSVYGNYSYLADYRPDAPFSEVERGLAEQLGVGLIRVRNTDTVELVSTAPRSVPVDDFKLQLADKMGYVRCTICATFFPRSETNKNQFSWDLLTKDQDNVRRMKEAIVEGKGLVYWPADASANDRTHGKRHRDGRVYNRRFACNTCARIFVGGSS